MANETYDINEIKRRMQGASSVLKTELSGLRTGRASAHMLDPVMVEAYGAQMPLIQVASVSVPEPRLITVNVWDRSLVHAVEKAIVNSNLGLSPATEGQMLRLRIPDRPGELAKLLGVLAGSGVNVEDIEHQRTERTLHLDEVEVALQLETRGPKHRAEVEEILHAAGYRLDPEI